MNYQHWDGFRDPRFGYGSMLYGFMSSIPKTVVFDENASVSVYMGVPYAVKRWKTNQHRVLFSMWETTELPAAFRRWLPQFDQVLVPCQHNVEVFSEFHEFVSSVPLGVDTKFWTPNGEEHNGPFRFHAGGSLWKRKGLDLVVQAFNKLKLPDAELHIKAAPHAKDVPIDKLGKNIYLHREWMSQDQQRDWFRKADCYVAVARGEGWGLMPLQAIASGIPTILSLSSGQKEFSDLAYATIGCKKSKAETIGFWDEPDLEQIEDAMKTVYENRDTASAESVAKSKLASKYTWQKATKSLLSAIPEGVLLNTADWTYPDVTMKIRVCRKVDADIGKRRYRLVPGVEYEVPENVHQVLFDSGALEE